MKCTKNICLYFIIKERAIFLSINLNYLMNICHSLVVDIKQCGKIVSEKPNFP